MRTLAVVGLLVVFLAATSLAAEIGPGTIETSFGGSFHLSPEPWQLMADSYLAYYVSPMLGIGPFLTLEKMGELDVSEASYDYTYVSAWHYNIGAFGKVYLPMAMAGGKMKPYVMLGFGVASLPKEWDVSDSKVEEKTETKPGMVFEVDFDYFVTDTWSIWFGYRGAKIFGDADTYFDANNRDMTDLQSSIEIGISNFIMK